MTEHQIHSPNCGDLIERLGSESDQALQAVIAAARKILHAREDARRRHATAEIRRIAKEHGLNVAVKKPARKRGRPKREVKE